MIRHISAACLPITEDPVKGFFFVVETPTLVFAGFVRVGQYWQADVDPTPCLLGAYKSSVVLNCVWYREDVSTQSC